MLSLISRAVAWRTAVINAVIEEGSADFAAELGAPATTVAGNGFRPKDFEGAISYCWSQAEWLQRKLERTCERIARQVADLAARNAATRDTRRLVIRNDERASLRREIAALNAAAISFIAAKAAMSAMSATKVAVIESDHTPAVPVNRDRR